MANPRGFRKIVTVPCPRCYAPIAHEGAVCQSKGCVIDGQRRFGTYLVDEHGREVASTTTVTFTATIGAADA